MKGQRPRKVVDWRPAFIAALSELGVISRAAKAADISTTTVWLERKNNEAFAEKYEGALQIGALQLVDEAVRRGRDGVRRMKFNSRTGEPYIDPGTNEPYIEHEYSDTLLLALLKRHFSEYREAKPDINVSTQVHNHIHSPERLKALRERHASALRTNG